MSRFRRRSIVAGTVVLVLAGALLGTAAAFGTDTVMPGVEVGGVDVSNLAGGELRAKLGDPARKIERRPITFLAGGHSWVRTPAEMGMRVDIEKSAAGALRAGRGGPVPWLGHRFFGSKSSVGWAVRVNRGRFAAALDRLEHEVNREPVSGEIHLQGKEVVVKRPEPGITLLRQKMEEIFAGAIARPSKHGRLILPVKIAQPAIGSAQLQVVKSQAESILSAPAEFVLEGRPITLAPEQIAATLRAEPATAGAPKAPARLVLRVDPVALAGQLGQAAPWGFRDPKDASFQVEKTTVRLVPSEDGTGVDAETAAGLVKTMAGPGQPRPVITLTRRTLPPALSTEEALALGIVERVSTFTTVFDPHFAPRVNNIDLIAKAIDGKIVQPGEVFSLNDATGERTPEKGYQVAQVIVDGELVPGLGGGVCQAGTATFNAAILAGLEILERRNHSLYISRYPVGRDASLYYGQYDLKFRNDTPYGLLLKAAVNSKYLNVNIYSTKIGRTVEFQTSAQRNPRTPSTKYIDDPALPRGEEAVVEAGKPGFDVTVTRTVREGDKLLRTDTFVSRYRPWKRIVRRGTGPPAPPKPSEPPSPSPTPTPEPAPTATPSII